MATMNTEAAPAPMELIVEVAPPRGSSAAAATAAGKESKGKQMAGAAHKTSAVRGLPSPSDHNFTMLLGPRGDVQVSVVVLRHQGDSGRHPKDPALHYYQARIRNSYPQKHIWSGWATKELVQSQVEALYADKAVGAVLKRPTTVPAAAGSAGAPSTAPAAALARPRVAPAPRNRAPTAAAASDSGEPKVHKVVPTRPARPIKARMPPPPKTPQTSKTPKAPKAPKAAKTPAAKRTTATAGAKKRGTVATADLIVQTDSDTAGDDAAGATAAVRAPLKKREWTEPPTGTADESKE